jgi:hypothetical protein
VLLNAILLDRTLRSVIPMIRGLIVLIRTGRRSAERVLGRDMVFVEPEFRGICSRIVGVDVIRGVVVLLFAVVSSLRDRDALATLLWGVHRISVCRVVRRFVGLRIVRVLASINILCLSSVRCLPREVTVRIVPMPPRKLSAMTAMRSALTC